MSSKAHHPPEPRSLWKVRLPVPQFSVVQASQRDGTLLGSGTRTHAGFALILLCACIRVFQKLRNAQQTQQTDCRWRAEHPTVSC